MRSIPNAGEVWIHYKRKLYKIICIAQQSKTGELIVVYQQLYEGQKIYYRSLDEFMEMLPDNAKKLYHTNYRFEKVRDR